VRCAEEAQFLVSIYYVNTRCFSFGSFNTLGWFGQLVQLNPGQSAINVKE
jgi:hypothetical protein